MIVYVYVIENRFMHWHIVNFLKSNLLVLNTLRFDFEMTSKSSTSGSLTQKAAINLIGNWPPKSSLVNNFVLVCSYIFLAAALPVLENGNTSGIMLDSVGLIWGFLNS